MARRRPSNEPNALVAAATRITAAGKGPSALGPRQPWQAEAWEFFDEVPEVKQGIRYRANQIGKVHLYVAVDNPIDADGDPIPVTDEASGVPKAVAEAAEAELARLRSQVGGAGEIKRMLDMQLEVVGESYLVGLAERTTMVTQRDGTQQEVTDAEDWQIRSISEVRKQADDTIILLARPGDQEGRKLRLSKPPAPDDDTIIRIWTRHPQWAGLPDCSLRGLLGDCRTLQVLSQQMQAEANSRQSAGAFTVPNELSFGPANPTDPDDGEDTEDPFQVELQRALVEPIQDPTSAASVMPMLIRGPAEFLKDDYLRRIDFARDTTEATDARMKMLVERIARGLNLPPEKVLGFASTTFCADEDTEVLTLDGWRRHDEVDAGTVVLTLNHETGIAEWQPTLDVSRFSVVDEPMLHIDRQAHSSLTTAHHRWPVVLADNGQRTWRKSAGPLHSRLNTNHRLTTAAPVDGLPAEPKWSDELVELAAWFYTEGHIDRRGYRDGHGVTVITQSQVANPGLVARIRQVLTRMVGAPQTSLAGTRHVWAWREYHDPNGRNVRFYLSRGLTEQLEVLAPDRVPTAEFVRSLTASQVELFLRVSVLGDGWVVNTGTVMFSQKDSRRVDAYELAVILSGRTPSRWTTTREGSGTLRGRMFTQHFCSMSERTTVQPISTKSRVSGQTEWVTYTGIVWCPTTPNQTWLARRNGSVYFTGNTNSAQIDEDEFNDYLAPSCETMVDSLTWAFLRPQLVENPAVTDEWVQAMYVWYDPSDLIRQPDTEDNADEALEKGAINMARYRKAKGYGEDDAPEPLELLTMFALRRGILTAELTAALLANVAAEAGLELPTPDELIEGEVGAGEGDPETDARNRAILDAVLASLSRGRLDPTVGARAPHALALNAGAATSPDFGAQLAAIDRDLRTRLVTAANAAMDRALERAGNRLRSRANGTELRARLRGVDPSRAWATLGRSVTAALLDPQVALGEAWDELERQFRTWGEQAQDEAIDVASRVVSGLSTEDRRALKLRQAQDLDEAWSWMVEALNALGEARMFDPDPEAPELGEFDPNVRVPTGLVRQALTRAGGMTGIQASDSGGSFVVLADAGTRPAGEIGTGEVIREVLRAGGASIEAYRWEYGPAFRQRPFDSHQRLDGTVFRNFDDPVLANPHPTFPPYPFLFAGDHEGCICNAVPVVVPADEVTDDE